jgi:hypothetical protein
VGSALLRPRLKAVGSFGRAGHTAHSTVVHGCAIAHTAEAMPPRCPATTGLRRSGRTWTPVCAAARGHVSAATDTAPSLDCPRCLLGCQATFLPPVGAATRSNRCGALLTLLPPRGPLRAPACGLPPSLPRPALASQTALWGRRAGSSRACHHTGASSSTADGTAAPPWRFAPISRPHTPGGSRFRLALGHEPGLHSGTGRAHTGVCQHPGGPLCSHGAALGVCGPARRWTSVAGTARAGRARSRLVELA